MMVYPILCLFIWYLVFATRISWIVGVSCPVVNQNCSCSSNNRTLTCSGLSEAPSIPGGPGLDYGLTSIQFFNGSISVLTANSLPPGLQTLEFQNHPLTNISDDAFGNLAENLTELTILGAEFRTPPSALLTLTSLDILTIAKSALEDWYTPGSPVTDGSNSTQAKQFHSLSALILTFNKISQIDFSYFPYNLVSLDLNSNNIKEIKYSQDNLPPLHLSNLLSIDLSNNKITTLRLDDVPPSTQTLDLYNNTITEIVDSNLTRNTSLTSLILLQNPIMNISPSAFHNLVQLNYINLENTALPSLPLALASLTSLKELNLWRAPLLCPCPAPDILLKWFDARNGQLKLDNAVCENNKFNVSLYLTNYCDTNSTGSTTPTAATVASTTHNNQASSITNNLVFIYSFSFIFAFCVIHVRYMVSLKI